MIGCVAAVVSNIIIGAVYFHPYLPSGRIWMKGLFPGKDEKEIGKESQFAMAFSIVTNIMISLLLKFLIMETFGAANIVDGLKFSVGLWCLTFLVEIPHVLFSRRSTDVFIIEQGHSLLSLAASGSCIGYFG